MLNGCQCLSALLSAMAASALVECSAGAKAAGTSAWCWLGVGAHVGVVLESWVEPQAAFNLLLLHFGSSQIYVHSPRLKSHFLRALQEAPSRGGLSS